MVLLDCMARRQPALYTNRLKRVDKRNVWLLPDGTVQAGDLPDMDLEDTKLWSIIDSAQDETLPNARLTTSQHFCCLHANGVQVPMRCRTFSGILERPHR